MAMAEDGTRELALEQLAGEARDDVPAGGSAADRRDDDRKPDGADAP